MPLVLTGALRGNSPSQNHRSLAHIFGWVSLPNPMDLLSGGERCEQQAWLLLVLAFSGIGTPHE